MPLFRTVWPLNARVLHALLATGVVMSFALQKVDGPWHEWPGYVALAAALGRMVYGLLPSTRQLPAHYTRFKYFLKGPRDTAEFLKRMLARNEPRFLGHNPVAAWWVLAILGCTIVAGVSGWLMLTDPFFGAAWLTYVHEWSGLAIGPLVCLHWFWLGYASWRHRENLLATMWHGKKKIELPSDAITSKGNTAEKSSAQE